MVNPLIALKNQPKTQITPLCSYGTAITRKGLDALEGHYAGGG